MILPPGHAQQIQGRRGFTRREKGMIGGVLGVVLALVVALVIALTTSDGKTGNGCISVSLGYSIGGQTFNLCGDKARSFCAGAHKNGLTGRAGDVVERACRKAGLTVG